MEENKEIIFKENLIDIKDRFGEKNQEGIKLALRETQNIFSCVSKAHQEEIANTFEVDSKLVSTIMKFIPSLKESIVKYEIICCTGRRCHQNGSEEVLRAAKKSLNVNFGETSKDGKIRLTTQNCFKKCGLGPNIKINDEFHHKMDKEKTIELMKEIKKKSQL